jgi:hypothetical protein
MDVPFLSHYLNTPNTLEEDPMETEGLDNGFIHKFSRLHVLGSPSLRLVRKPLGIA